MTYSNVRRNDEYADVPTHRKPKSLNQEMIIGILKSSSGTMVPVDQNRCIVPVKRRDSAKSSLQAVP